MKDYTPPEERERGWNFTVMQWARDYVNGLDALERGLLLQLAMHSDLSFECFPAQTTLAKSFGRDPRTIRKALKSLEEKGLITRKRRRASTTLYTLHVPPAIVRDIQDKKRTSGPKRNAASYPERKSASGSDGKCNALEVTTGKKPVEVTNEVPKGIEVSVEKTGDMPIGKSQMEKSQEENCENEGEGSLEKESSAESDQRKSVALKTVGKYYKAQPSRKVMVGFWWALMKQFFPDYRYVKLSGYQYRALGELFQMYQDSAYYVIAAAICDWGNASVHAANCDGLRPFVSDDVRNGDIPKLGPTPTFICKAHGGFHDYWIRHWQGFMAA